MKGDIGHARRLSALLDRLNFREGHYFIGGSGPMVLRDMRALGDLDIGVTTRYWFELQSRPEWEVWTTEPDDPKRRCDPPYLRGDVGGTEVNIFYAWRRRVDENGVEYGSTDYNDLFRNCLEYVEGWPCVKLAVILRLKSEVQRDKDFNDIRDLATIIKLEKANIGVIRG